MKKICLLFFAVLAINFAKSQYVTLPDTNLTKALIQYFPACFNAAKQLDTTYAKANVSGYLGFFNRGIVNASGIHYFKLCDQIDFSGNRITNLPKLPDSCKSLTLSNCGLSSTGIVLSGFTKITNLTIDYDSLTTLPALPPNLTFLNCSNNQLTQIGNLPTNLQTLYAYTNKINQVVNLPTGLKSLALNNNLLTTLPALPTSLINLNCPYNLLSSLPSLPNTITQLQIDHNSFTTLPALPNALQVLYCGNNQISALPALPSTLTTLECANNSLTTLPTLNTALTYLNIQKNLLSALPVLPTNLMSLYADSNRIATIPSTLKRNWETLSLSSNQITQINFGTDSLMSFQTQYDLSNNQITSLSNLPTNLYTLYISQNPIATFPSFPNYSTLRVLYMDRTNITVLNNPPNSLYALSADGNNFTQLTLPINASTISLAFSKFPALTSLPNALSYLDVSFSNISSIPKLPEYFSELRIVKTPNLKCLPKINDTLYIIYMDSSAIRCIPNRPRNPRYINTDAIDSLFYATKYDSIPIKYFTPLICNATNNNNGCNSYPVFTGKVYSDVNNNNIKDATENYVSNIAVKLSAINKGFTNANGVYSLTSDTIGSNTLTFTAPRFYAAVPPTYSKTIGSYDTLVNVPDIALQKTITKDSLAVKITPLNWAARPGFKYPYYVQYQNVGSTTLNATATVFYSNSLLNYDSSSNNSVTNTGNSLNLTLNSFTPWQQERFIAYFKIKPTTSIGTVLKTYATIAGGTATASDSTRVVIGGSYDPNDKQATPQLTPANVAEGKFINYTVRFQNTGTDTAFTVVVADTLSSLLQASTFEMLSSSHTCKATIQDNKVYFEFFNILLPDSNVNQIKSNGFVNFRIKPVSSVTVGTIIPNKASIYFDYNAPVVTNTANTNISSTILPVTLVGFNAAFQYNKTVLLYWNTVQELNTQSFVVEESFDGKSFTVLDELKAKGTGSNNYYSSKKAEGLSGEIYFRLKMIDKDGAVQYSNTVKLQLNSKTAGFSIIKNPAKTVLTIEVKNEALSKTQARLITAQGIVVKTFNLQLGYQNIDISNLKQGMYYLQTNIQTKQVVVE